MTTLYAEIDAMAPVAGGLLVTAHGPADVAAVELRERALGEMAAALRSAR
jgi:hypothetical protein